MKSVGYFQEAREELDDAAAVSSDPTAFRRVVDEALRDVAIGLMIHAKYPRTRYRVLILTGLPYSLIYDDLPTEIRVIAVAHHKRRPGYWKKRLRRP